MQGHLIKILALSFIITSCGINEPDGNAENAGKINTCLKHDNYFKDVQEYLFRYSVCIDDCNAPESIIYARYNGDSLRMKLGIVLNCVGDFVIDVVTRSDTLDLKIDPRPVIVYNADGKADTVTMVTDCDCFFTFDIGLHNLRYRFKEYLVNGIKPGSIKREKLLNYQ